MIQSGDPTNTGKGGKSMGMQILNKFNYNKTRQEISRQSSWEDQ